MPKKTTIKKPAFRIGGIRVLPGETKNISLTVSETYTGAPIQLPIRVIRAKKAGPTVFISGAVHGDELNGTGIVREIMMKPLPLIKGTLICLPIANILGFEQHSRYLPDRRDLNRCFPGSKDGSLANRLAHAIYKEIVCKCDFGMDLHTAAVRRTNFPQIRADLSVPGMEEIVRAFGCEVIIDKEGHPNSLRETATKRGCLTMLYEAGEVLKFEPGTIKLGVRGVKNVLKKLEMLPGKCEKPVYQSAIKKSKWKRADVGGLLHFHVKPGSLVKKGAVLARVENLFTGEKTAIKTERSGIVIGITTLPAVKPGEPFCHVGYLGTKVEAIKKKVATSKTLHRDVQQELASNIKITPVKKKR